MKQEGPECRSRRASTVVEIEWSDFLGGSGPGRQTRIAEAGLARNEYPLRIVDTATGSDRSYFNPIGVSADAITDTMAFATCTRD